MDQGHWLFKSEPNSYSYDDLVRDGGAEWDGVRNFQARNMLKSSIKEGDSVLFYHSNAKPMAVIGTAVVVRDGYPDYTAWDLKSDHPDPKSTPDKPLWYMVDIKATGKFPRPVTLGEIKGDPRLADMVLVKASRLSVQPVTAEQWDVVCELGKGP
jgi:predicted RNA-binding protein with PUA-like domain